MKRSVILLSLAALAATSLPAAAQSLTQTRWIFTQIGTERLDAQARARTAFALDPQTKRLAASAGCNRMAGGYAQEGASISFGRMAMTRMACPPPLDGREQALAAALGNVRQWRIARGRLILSDANGRALLRLAAAKR